MLSSNQTSTENALEFGKLIGGADAPSLNLVIFGLDTENSTRVAAGKEISTKPSPLPMTPPDGTKMRTMTASPTKSTEVTSLNERIVTSYEGTSALFAMTFRKFCWVVTFENELDVIPASWMVAWTTSESSAVTCWRVATRVTRTKTESLNPEENDIEMRCG